MLQFVEFVENWCLANRIPFQLVIILFGSLIGSVVLHIFDNIYFNLPYVKKKRMKRYEEQAILEAFNQTIKK